MKSPRHKDSQGENRVNRLQLTTYLLHCIRQGLLLNFLMVVIGRDHTELILEAFAEV